MLTIADAVATSHVFDGLSRRYLELIAGCARFVRFDAGVAIFLEGQVADRFYVLREGHVTLEVFSPERGRIAVQTLGPGDALGWSWLFPPYTWHLDAVAREPVAAVAFDGACLRGRIHTDHELGHGLMARFGNLMLQRLKATRLQLLDVYAHGSRCTGPAHTAAGARHGLAPRDERYRDHRAGAARGALAARPVQRAVRVRRRRGPISISGDSGRPDRLVHTVRSVGAVSAALGRLRRGHYAGVRCPFGSTWPRFEAR